MLEELERLTEATIDNVRRMTRGTAARSTWRTWD